MKKFVWNAAAAASVFSMTALPAAAQSADWWSRWERRNGGGDTVTASSVPEIDASTGLLAMAAVGAALLLAWEVNRRRSKS